MRLSTERLSSRYTVRPVTEADLPELLALAQGNPTYYEYLHTQPSLENLREDLTKLPQGKRLEDKYFLGYFQDERLIAVLDLITGYPNEETAFIGWFILRKDLQGQGIASGIINELMFRLPFRYIRLGYVKGNRESERFWKKYHFAPTGLELDGGGYTIVVMQLGRGDTHAFGLMPQPPEPGQRYDEYNPERYVCAWAEDDALNEIAPQIAGASTFLHTLDCPGEGLAWYGVTLLPPASLDAFLAALDGRMAFRELRKLFEQAKAENSFVIHFGI